MNELKNKGVLNEEKFNLISKDISSKKIANAHQNMVQGNGVWATIAHKIANLASLKLLYVVYGAINLAKSRLEKSGHKRLDQASTVAKKRITDGAVNLAKMKLSGALDIDC